MYTRNPTTGMRNVMVLTYRQVRRLTVRRELRSRCERWLVLVAFVVANLGLPMGGLGSNSDPKTHAMKSGTINGCRCSPQARQAGLCCCSKRPGAAGCCSTNRNVRTQVKSCCAKKAASEATVSERATSEPDEGLAWHSSCPCGPAELPFLLVCAQPRMLTAATTFDIGTNRCDWLRSASDSPCGQRPSPYVPPPESSVA